MITELYNYDIFPKVVPADCESLITIRPLGKHAEFKCECYSVEVRPIEEGNPRDYPDRPNHFYYKLKPDSDGCIRLRHFFAGEQEHYIRFTREGEERRFLQLSVYSLAPDLYSRRPFIGDFHMHTMRSDGREDPSVVAANYRKHGYDFLVITDHRRYYPSLEVMASFKDIKTEYTVIPGEEVHLPKLPGYINDVHIVNAGSEYSVNALVPGDHQKEVGDGVEYRSLNGSCPATISEDEMVRQITELIPSLDIPEGVEKFAYASCVWIFEHIKKGNGLGIFAHPYWISDVFQVPESLIELMMERHPFDAYEVLGGERYYSQNGLQTIRYFEDRAKGRIFPIVGSTDSHSSVNNINAYVASTIVFAESNTRESILQAVRDYYSVAIDGISAELRYVGGLRLVKYTNFLMTNYFPLHDELCFEEGRLMKEYVTGTFEESENAKALLASIYGRVSAQREKYFN